MISDNMNGWSASTPDRLTCKVAGWYVVTATCDWVAGTTGTQRRLALWGNFSGVGIAIAESGPAGAALTTSAVPTVSTTGQKFFNVGDYIRAMAYHDYGTPLSVYGGGALSNGNENYCSLAMALAGGPQGPAGVGVPSPVVNGQWIKGVGGAAVWQPIAQTDLPAPVQGQPAAISDLNNATNAGWYTAMGSTANTPTSGAYGHCRVLALPTGGGDVYQVFSAYNGDSEYQRRKSGGGAWGAWQQTRGGTSGGLLWLGPFTWSPGSIAYNSYATTTWTHNFNSTIGRNPSILNGYLEDVNYGINNNWHVQSGSFGANGVNLFMECIANIGGGNQGTAVLHLMVGG